MSRWPEWCWNCGVVIEQPEHQGRPKIICGHPLCVNVRRYWRHYGRRPGEQWFVKYAVAMGWMKAPKLPKRLKAMAER